MTEQKRSRDGGNIWMILLILLALIATVIMLFSDSAVWLQIALLAALWAAILGFMLVSRSRNDRDAAEALLDAQAREHEAELEAYRAREEANRNAVEAARASGGLPPAADMEILREIREELATLRAQLEDLSGREFGYEPAALQAEARRVREIEARAHNAASSSFTRVRPESTPTVEPVVEPAAPKGEPKVEPAVSNRWTDVVAEDDTTRIAAVREEDEGISSLQGQNQQPGAWAKPQQASQQSGTATVRPGRGPSTDAVAGRVGSHRASEGPNPLTDLIRERQEELERQQREEQERRQREQEQRELRERQQREAAERARREREEQERRQREAREAEERRQREAAERARREREEQERRQREAREAEERRQRDEQERLQREAEEARRREEDRRQAEAREAEESRGRRRADEHREGALSVAELLARSKRNQ